MMLRVCLVFMFFVAWSFAQNDTLDAREAPTSIELSEKRAKTAAYLSLLLPGAGQFYNKSYWKIPVIYAALGLTGYLAYSNHKNYVYWRDAYIAKVDDDPATPDLFPDIAEEVLRSQRNSYRRNRDFSLLIMSFVYILNSVEAYVDAHLKDFDVSDNLSLSVRPYYSPVQRNTGLLLTLKFK